MRGMTDDTLSGYPAEPDDRRIATHFGCWRRHMTRKFYSCDQPVVDPALGLCADHLHEMRNSK